jgi:hypothetical protein
MSGSRLLFFFSVVLFGLIGVLSFFQEPEEPEGIAIVYPGQESTVGNTSGSTDSPVVEVSTTVSPPRVAVSPLGVIEAKSETGVAHQIPIAEAGVEISEVNRVDLLLFNKGEGKLSSIVETVTYKSIVPWKKGRAAWLVDYAGHYKTHSHFIARSLTGKSDYFTGNVNNGDRFNVYRSDKEISFHLVIDVSRTKMLLYVIDGESKERTLLKTYLVGLGRPDPTKDSGSLTPLGKYKLGSRTAIFKPKAMGSFNGARTEMVTVFGSRWIPFEEAIAGCTAPAKGFGIHGVPWKLEGGEYKEQKDTVGRYESDGCIRMLTEDVEELFAIISMKDTVVELVDDFRKAQLPGTEKTLN